MRSSRWRTGDSTRTGAWTRSGSPARSSRTTGAAGSSRAAAPSRSSSRRCSSSRRTRASSGSKEAVLALELEHRYSKDRILEMYLNQVYFGHSAYGVEAAARTYFGKSVPELSVREAALLAALPRAPSSYSPFDHANAAKRRREVVLRRMVEYGALKDQEAKRIARSDLGLIPPERRRTTGQYFLDYVQQTLRSEEHTSELQSPVHLVCRLLLEKKKKTDLRNTCACHRSPRHHAT